MKVKVGLPEGVKLTKTPRFPDDRGIFVKHFTPSIAQEMGFHGELVEDFTTLSHKGVLRGFHLQAPPYDHDKIVTCLTGVALDVILDVRRNSPTYLHHFYFDLGLDYNAVIIPRGFAHAFLAITDNCLMSYKVNSLHRPDHDIGIKWDTVGFNWPCKDPIISVRDNNLPALNDFVSPF